MPTTLLKVYFFYVRHNGWRDGGHQADPERAVAFLGSWMGMESKPGTFGIIGALPRGLGQAAGRTEGIVSCPR